MAKAKTKTKAFNARKPAARRKTGRVTPVGFKHETPPIFVGMMAAEFLPADPAIWLGAARLEGMDVAIADDRMLMTWLNVEPDRCQFLLGWLHGTLGGEEAIAAFLRLRG